MNAIPYWPLMALSFGVQVWGLVIDLQDLTLLGAIAAFGVLGVDRLLLRADRDEEFADAGEEL
ncbi:hypothetical protein [Streptomyces zaomyceticus]|uniref:hypothetical protein n=1 Tax=Streptomyces zaomyceticus TaxID=68286 RepID=UPI002E166F41|nr:hypothetical protein OG237_15600 [Streptomyces zaomyceticus]